MQLANIRGETTRLRGLTIASGAGLFFALPCAAIAKGWVACYDDAFVVNFEMVLCFSLDRGRASLVF